MDLPGYGYAKVSKAQKNDWNKVLRNYLRGRANLRCVFVLVDGRHGIKENDIEIMKMLDEVAAPYRVILTKTDKVKDEVLRERKEKTEELLKKHPAAYPQIMFTSAEKRYGLNELQEQVVRVIVGQ